MQRAQAALLPGGRLHLNHGPIDLIVGVSGPARDAAYARASRRFATVLTELVCELPALRQPPSQGSHFDGAIARRMAAAVAPFAEFITPMAAVAGAVADEMIAVIRQDPNVAKAYVNNGGDVAFHLAAGQTLAAAIPHTGEATITASDDIRGVATSGWRGRSHSLGIADSVTVLARSAAAADAAATLIANAVDLPGNPNIRRRPANALAPDSDLGHRQVTIDVPALDPSDKRIALDRGCTAAQGFAACGLIVAAVLLLQGETRTTGELAPPRLETSDA